MRAPTANDLLRAWEGGLDQSPTRRALGMLAAASPEIAPHALAALPLGERDARLLRLRESLFGEAVTGVSQCPACGERLEVAFRVDEVRAETGDVEGAVVGSPTHRLRVADYDITYRVPTSADLLAVSTLPVAVAPQPALLQRCVIAAHQSGVATLADALPDTVIAALSNAMAEADPQAQIELALICPACGRRWGVLFDIAAFLWNEINAWAQRTLRDVATLARAYGWREADILAMNVRRREMYLELARS